MSLPERRYVPEVRRPRGPAWRTLQADGLIWECQVFLVGAEVDLAALLIVTRNRFALARGGNVVLETDRAWLRPAPRLLPDGTVLINVAPPATADGQPESHSLLLRMREGWRDASHLESLLSGGRGRSAAGRRTPTAPPAAPADPRPGATTGDAAPASGRQDGYRWHDDASPPAAGPAAGRSTGRWPATEPDLPWARPRLGQRSDGGTRSDPAAPSGRDSRNDPAAPVDTSPRGDRATRPDPRTRPNDGPATDPAAGRWSGPESRQRGDPRSAKASRPDQRTTDPTRRTGPADATTTAAASAIAPRTDRAGAASRPATPTPSDRRPGPDDSRTPADPALMGGADSLAGTASSRRARSAPWSAEPGAVPIEASVRSNPPDPSAHAQGPYVVPAPAGPPPSGRYFDWNAPDTEVVTSRQSRRKRGWWGRLTGILLLLLTVTAIGVMLSDRGDDGRVPARTEVAAVGDSPMTGSGTEPVAGSTGDGGTVTPSPVAGESGTRPTNPETAVAIGVGGEGSLTPSAVPSRAVPPAPATDIPATDIPAGDPNAVSDPTTVPPVAPATASVTPTGDSTADPPAAPTGTVSPATAVAPTAPASDPTPTPTSQRSADRPGDGTSGAEDEVVGTGSAAEVGTAVGTTPSPDPAAIATATTTPDPTAEPTEPATEPAPEAPATVEPAATATVAPTRTPRPTATETAPPPTETVVPPTETPTPEPTEAPTPEPTETPVPPTDEPEPVFPDQAATVDEDTYTAPVMGADAFRVTVESTMRGPSLPTLGLPGNPYGDWLVAIVLMENWSDAPANLVMADFGLITASPFVAFQPLDSGTEVVGATLGFSTVLGPDDVEVVPAGDARRVALLFTANPSGIGLSLRYGESVIGLQSSLEISPNATDLSAPVRTPVLLPATVTAIIDGSTIEVEADGAVARVRYAALSAPAEDDCYGPEATEANAALVEVGETVYLERQATDVAEDGTLVRDVWLDRDGGLVMAGQVLAAQGALDVVTDGPDVRYLSWLELTVSDAAFAGLGQWGACGTASTGSVAAVGDAGGTLAYLSALPNPPRDSAAE